MQKATQKHLTLSDRNYIEQALNAGMTFKDIGRPRVHPININFSYGSSCLTVT